MPVLVAYASRHGSTQGIAERIAAILQASRSNERECAAPPAHRTERIVPPHKHHLPETISPAQTRMLAATPQAPARPRDVAGAATRNPNSMKGTILDGAHLSAWVAAGVRGASSHPLSMRTPLAR
jgi:hypothetical protein